MTNSNLGLSIVLPCYNEEQAIEKVLTDLESAAPKILSQCQLENLEIIVVNDGSTDRSSQILDKFPNVKKVELNKNCGYGFAIKQGVRCASHAFVAITDMDNTCEPRDFIKLFAEFKENQKLNMVVGWRVHKASKMPMIRKIGNSFYSFMIFLMTGKIIKDPCSGIRIYKKDWLNSHLDILPDDLDFTLATTMVSLNEKETYCERTIGYNDRIGDSKLGEFKYGIIFLLTILRYRLRKLQGS